MTDQQFAVLRSDIQMACFMILLALGAVGYHVTESPSKAGLVWLLAMQPLYRSFDLLWGHTEASKN